jgi:hypothetical protein
MATIKHFGGQDYKVLHKGKEYGPMSIEDAREKVAEIEEGERNLTPDEVAAGFAEMRRKLNGESFSQFFKSRQVDL